MRPRRCKVGTQDTGNRPRERAPPFKLNTLYQSLAIGLFFLFCFFDTWILRHPTGCPRQARQSAITFCSPAQVKSSDRTPRFPTPHHNDKSSSRAQELPWPPPLAKLTHMPATMPFTHLVLFPNSQVPCNGCPSWCLALSSPCTKLSLQPGSVKGSDVRCGSARQACQHWLDMAVSSFHTQYFGGRSRWTLEACRRWQKTLTAPQPRYYRNWWAETTQASRSLLRTHLHTHFQVGSGDGKCSRSA